MTAKYGLFDLKGTPLPLTSVEIKGFIHFETVELHLSQFYENPNNEPIEAVFLFPKHSEHAVTGMEVEMGDTVVKGKVIEANKAAAKYSDAISEGNQAFLLETKKGDVLQLSVGNLPPKCKAKVKMSLVSRLKQEGTDGWRLNIPLTIASLYTPPSNPSSALGVTHARVDYRISISLDFETVHPIFKLESVSHSNLCEIEYKECRGSIRTKSPIMMDQDFVVMMNTRMDQNPQLLVETTTDGHSAYGIFLSEPELPEESSKTRPTCEFVFVLDRSGSMSGSRVTDAIQALRLFLRSLPSKSYFNVYGFGTNFVSIFNSSQPYNDATLGKASKEVDNWKADLGGTEIFTPLSTIFKMESICQKRIVFVLTDGEVSNTEQVIKLVRENSDKNQVFTFGIGASVSHALINGMAKAGNGTAEFSLGEKLAPKVMRQLQTAILPVVTLHVDWGTSDILTYPTVLHGLLPGERICVYGLPLANSKLANNIVVTLTKGEKETKHTFSLEKSKTQQGSAMHQLIVYLYASGQPWSKQILDLSLQYQVLTQWTSILAVGGKKGATTLEPMKLINVPLPPASNKVSLGGDSFTESFISTIGVDFKIVSVDLGNGQTSKGQIWDTAGQERFRTITSSYYRGVAGVILVYSADDEQSFDNLETWRKEVERYSPTGVPIIIVGNKIDLPRKVPTSKGQAYADKFNFPFFEVSCKTGEGLAEAFYKLYEEMYLYAWRNNTTPTFKSLFLGDSGVGKSAMNLRMGNGHIDLSSLAAQYPIGSSASSSPSQANPTSNSSSSQSSKSFFSGLMESVKSWFTFSPSTENRQRSTSQSSPPQSTSQSSLPQSTSQSTQSIQTKKIKSFNYESLILLQSSEGFWRLEESFSKLLDTSVSTIQNARPSFVSSDEIWATILAIVSLEMFAENNKTEWTLVVRKAKDWLQAQSNINKDQTSSAFQDGKQFLESL